MKKTFATIFLLSAFALTIYSQSQYETLPDANGGKMLKGVISREILAADTSFRWYRENQQGYHPNEMATQAMHRQSDSLQFIVFMGTWCEDSHFVIPKLFMLLDAAGIAGERVSLVAVDRNKKTVAHLSEAMSITNVPTIIVMKNGKEEGRVVEFGKSGFFDKDLGEIIARP